MMETIVIVGGGIAGTSTIDGLMQELNPDQPQFSRIILISTDRIVKKVHNYQVRGRNLEFFDIIEQGPNVLNQLVETNNKVEFEYIVGNVKQIHPQLKLIVYSDISGVQKTVLYNVLVICTGASPKKLSYSSNSIDSRRQIDERLISIRDTESVLNLRSRIGDCRRIVIVGNGGISLELVSKISDCEKVWIIKDDFIGQTFIDSAAARFLLEYQKEIKNTVARTYARAGKGANLNNINGPSMGPDWCQNIDFNGSCSQTQKLNIVCNDELTKINAHIGGEFPLTVETRDGKTFQCDLVVEAIGVQPNLVEIVRPSMLEIDELDGAILIDNEMRTSIKDIYAAGDCVSCNRWSRSTDDLWFQKRLWTQARQMGNYAGRCIVSHIEGLSPSIYNNFECFTHCTKFFGFKVILLGRYNGQSLNAEELKRCEALVRVNPGENYIKLILMDGRIIGAVLVGESGQEETIENLIHDKIDVSSYKDQLIDGTVDIDDYFD